MSKYNKTNFIKSLDYKSEHKYFRLLIKINKLTIKIFKSQLNILKQLVQLNQLKNSLITRGFIIKRLNIESLMVKEKTLKPGWM